MYISRVCSLKDTTIKGVFKTLIVNWQVMLERLLEYELLIFCQLYFVLGARLFFICRY